jgi:uracil-DNA glycosylase family 4
VSFFSFKDNQPKAARKTYGCQSCGLLKSSLLSTGEPVGEGRLGILLLGEYPTSHVLKKMTPGEDKMQALLRANLKDLRVDMGRDCWFANSVRCPTTDDKRPKSICIESCWGFLRPFLEARKPKVVILLGDVAIEAWIGRHWKKELEGVERWRGWTIPDHEFGCWVCPTWGLSFFRQEYILPVIDKLWMEDLNRALGLACTPIPPPINRNCVRLLNEGEAINYLSDLLWHKIQAPISVDYEATGLKPQNRGHRILCCAICDGTHSSAFMITENIKPHLAGVMNDPEIRKIAANNKYEDTWTNVILGVPVRGWMWDTVVAAHTLDNRSGVSNVKFQACVNFGIYDYDSHIEEFKEGEENNANSFNRMHEVPEKDLLTYCSMDSLIEWHLAMKQQALV